jgi:hypothetical protein
MYPRSRRRNAWHELLRQDEVMAAVPILTNDALGSLVAGEVATAPVGGDWYVGAIRDTKAISSPTYRVFTRTLISRTNNAVRVLFNGYNIPVQRAGELVFEPFEWGGLELAWQITNPKSLHLTSPKSLVGPVAEPPIARVQLPQETTDAEAAVHMAESYFLQAAGAVALMAS